jgi:hypothetical protein
MLAQLFAVAPDGTGLVQLTSGPTFPTFNAALGERVVYSRFEYEPDTGPSGPSFGPRPVDVASVLIDGSGTAVLTDAPDSFAGAAADHVYLMRATASGGFDLYSTNPAGGLQTLLATDVERLDATITF